MNNSPDTVIEIFNEALKRASAERADYLDVVCASNGELRQRVERLLGAYDRAGEFLSEPVAILRGGAAPKPPAGEGPGDRIGPYKLLQQIGEGGCGVVFMAEQEQPLRRRVALKVVKPGMDTRSVIARFEAERQALTLMEHPNIARVYDAGATDSGRPYFVMELVRGSKITDYCDQNSVTTSGRLELFVQVCHAIQHAHQKGIIHRDIKPSNILVTTTEEGTPLPKVIDFGIAKATTGQQLTDKTFFTAFEMLIGTPAYMSPEQAALTSMDVDTRSDIYSLGVLLYELLTGTPPFDVRELLKVGLDEIRRVILNKDPIRPSTRLKTMLNGDLTLTAQHRRVEPVRLIRTVRGDLDWIVMKALEKDRSRRYATANALASDVQHYLTREPVSACPPTALYKLKKLILRNRLLAGGVMVLGLVLVSGLAVVSILLAREKQARLQAETEKQTAKTETSKSKEVTKFLSDMLEGVAPTVALGRDTKILKEILDRTDQRIAIDLTNQPDVETELRLKMGAIYTQLNNHEIAERMFRRALELNPHQETPNVAIALFRLGVSLLGQNKLEDSERQLQLSLELWRKLKDEEGRYALRTLESLAMLRCGQRRFDEAEALMRRVYAARQKLFPPDDEELPVALGNIGNILVSVNKLSEAEEAYRKALEAKRRLYGDEHPRTMTTFKNLGAVLGARGKINEAKENLTRAVALERKFLDRSHPGRIGTLNNLAELQWSSGDLAQAELLYKELIALGKEQPDPYNPTVIQALKRLVSVMSSQGKSTEIGALFAELLPPGFERSPASIPGLNVRVDFLARTGRWREAVADASRLIEWQPEEHAHYHTLAPLLVADGQLEAYRKLCAEIVTRFAGTTDTFVADRMAKDCLIHPSAAADYAAVAAMAEIAVANGQGVSSKPLFLVCKALAEYRQGNFTAAAEWAQKVDGSIPVASVEACAVLAMARNHLKQPESARERLAQCAADFETKLPKLERGDLGDDWRDWIVARALLTEARALIEGNEQTNRGDR